MGLSLEEVLLAKLADGESSGGTLQSAAGASPIPQPQVVARLAPGKTGPVGMGFRNNFTRVNSGTPPVPDAGASSQKSLLPKYGSSMNGNHATRPALQDMVKAAQQGALARFNVEEEARRQAGEDPPATKTASATATKITTEYAEKIAHALEWTADNLDKIATGPGTGPGALKVTEAIGGQPVPQHQGEGHQQPPMHPASAKAGLHDPATALEKNKQTPGHAPTKIASDALFQKNLEHLQKVAKKDKEEAPASCEHCGKEKSACTCTKTASLAQKNLEHLRKLAEDRINPAHISAGPAVPPETSMSGQPGGMPVGGKPGPGTELVGSNESAKNYTKGQAKSGPKADLKSYFTEPALTSATDKTLSLAFAHTPEAGTKFAGAEETPAQGDDVKTAAAAAYLETLLEGTK